MTQPQHQVDFVQPSPNQQTWLVQVPQPNTVIVSILSCTGQFVSFLAVEAAVQIGQQLMDAGRQARSGIIIPQNITLPPLSENGGVGRHP